MSSNPAVTIGVTAVDKASGVLRSLDQQVVGTTSKIEQSNDKAAKSTERSTKQIISSYTSIATSIGSLTSGIVGFATSFDAIEKAQARANAAQVTYERSLQRLNDLKASGKATSEELATAELEVTTNLDKLRLAQDNVNDTTLTFYANIPSQIISFGTAATSAFTAYTANTKLAESATKAFNFIAKATFLTNPAFIAITGISTLIVLLATNTFGLRDAFLSAGDAIHDFLDVHFKPLADLMKWFYDNVLAPLGAFVDNSFNPSIQTASAETSNFANVTNEAGNAVEKTTSKVKTYNDYLEDMQKNTADTIQNNLWFIETTNKQAASLVQTGEEINLVAGFLREQQQELERTTAEDFELVASIEGLETAIQVFRTGELAAWADGLRLLQEQTKEASKELDDLREKTGGGDIVERAIKAGLVGEGAEIIRKGKHRFTAIERHATGGIIAEPTLMMGLNTGRLGLAGEAGIEEIKPIHSRSNGGTAVINLVINGQAFASAVVNDLNDALKRKRTIEMRITHEAIHHT